MERIVFNNTLNAVLAAIFVSVVLCVLVYAVKTILYARSVPQPTATEVPYERAPAEATVHV
jgi:carbon starvation protein